MKLMVWSLLQPALHHSTALWAYRTGLVIDGAVVCFSCHGFVSACECSYFSVRPIWMMCGTAVKNQCSAISSNASSHPGLSITSFSTAGNNNAITDKTFFLNRSVYPNCEEIYSHWPLQNQATLLHKTLMLDNSDKSWNAFHAIVFTILDFWDIYAWQLRYN